MTAQSVKDSTFLQQGDNSKFVVGTYILSTFLNGDFIGRRVITLTQDGNFFAIDSNQGGTKGVPVAAQSFPNNRFTDGQGVWKVNKSGEIVATAFNFNFPAPDSTASVTTARADYRFTFDSTTQTVEGKFEIRTFDLTKNPLDKNEPVGEGEPFTFSFTGQRVTVDE
ncbi:hypothetical protein I8748_10530 [Nostoc sp. CENA67]|uniref:Uncharacterized protein n=1 Tax=Amazonocrinis nigriterrae CENA67 TaxID=2794033 RepID=A0A8J7L6S3_9NOST|nr:hypothetical protein [Amazonocrinis nigriterrae]MBH8562609.1 hypothetical protein [Amazonocrinis nigriterrae CENA67]